MRNCGPDHCRPDIVVAAPGVAAPSHPRDMQAIHDLHDGPFDCPGEQGFVPAGYAEPEDELDEEAEFLDKVFLSRAHHGPVGPGAPGRRTFALSAHLPFYCGEAGFVFHRSPDEFNATLERTGALAKRFGGAEISASERPCYLASRGLPRLTGSHLQGTITSSAAAE